MDRKKLLIIGCGDLGERLAACAGDEFDVYGLRRHPPADARAGIHYLRGDASDRATMDRVLARNFDAIVLTLTPAARSDEGYRRGYVTPCETLIEALAGRSPRILFISSTSVYGQANGEWVDEATAARPPRYNGQRVLEAEQLLAAAGLPLVVLRLAGIYGPGRTRLMDSVAAGKTEATEAYTNRIHADDAAGFMAWVLKMDEPASLYLLSDGESPRKGQVVNWLAQQLGVAPPPEGESASLNKRIDNRAMRASGYPLRYPGFKAGFAELIRR
ncbi:SDR family oxidoreductase [Gilvimarinus xylanilyticus]|uniref:SDR family oxidoreductase n=1 Tax=Gilvimarinus xylanilyticus TaxID=2944139 RepID=A0A9X2HZQ4_9GAMM|nr:SDR family oxidoreductase [Gilvimarinus xylanilyticus]MCP8901015.1 SDR family oxidoreductase [Gilvimarinus xylanilyticus]